MVGDSIDPPCRLLLLEKTAHPGAFSLICWGDSFHRLAVMDIITGEKNGYV